jgi:hypothetical protein
MLNNWTSITRLMEQTNDKLAAEKLATAAHGSFN